MQPPVRVVVAVAVAAAMGAGAGAKVVIPEVNEVTQGHLAALEKVKAVAEPAAAAGRQELLEMLASSGFRKEFERHVGNTSELLGETPEGLLRLMREEFEVSEMTHNWEPRAGQNGYHDIDLNLASTIPSTYMLNLWQLGLLGLNDPDQPYQIYDDAEARVYKLPFLNITKPSLPTYEEASSRLVYSALNYYKLGSASSLLFGGCSFVLDNEHVRNYTAIGAGDTGTWELCCGPYRKSFNETFYVNCAEETYLQPGTFDHWEHLVVANVRFWNTTILIKRSRTPEQNLGLLVARMVGRGKKELPKGLPHVSLSEQLYYSEATPMMNLNYKKGVKMLLFNFTDLMGTWEAGVLREWAIQNNWVVAWTMVPDILDSPDDMRFLDPVVLAETTAGVNITNDPAFAPLAAAFATQFAFVNKTTPMVPRPSYKSWIAAQWTSAWDLFKASILQVQPLYRGACASPSCSVTRVVDGACVCR